MAKCALCGFDLDEAGKKVTQDVEKPEPGRQYTMSMEIYDGVWVCGTCRDTIRDRN